ncbi:MAG: DUF362 domain-containing protein [Verrucomicrobiota bacterium]
MTGIRCAVLLLLAILPTVALRAELPPPRPDSTPSNSVVFFALDQQAMGPGMTPRFPLVSRMVEGLVCAVTGKSNPKAAWLSLVKPGEKIGIKVSAQPGPVGGTHPAVAQAVVEGLISAGIAPSDIMVWDRSWDDLQRCGYDETPGLNLRWVEKGAGYDPRAVVTTPAIGQLVYGDLSFKETRSSLDDILGPKAQLSNESHLPVLLARQIDRVINIPSLCDSYFTGVHGALACMTVGILDNWRRFSKGDGYGDSALAEVYADERIQKKVVLTLMDGMVLQYAGGPYPSPVNCTSYASLFASKDPVAIDATALRLIDEQRLLSKMPKASDDGGHVEQAASMGLGNNEERMILLRRIGTGGSERRSMVLSTVKPHSSPVTSPPNGTR